MTIKTLQFAIFGTILSLVGLQAWRWTRAHEAPGLIDIATIVLLVAQLAALEAPRRRGLVRFPNMKEPGAREELRQFAPFAILGAVVLVLMLAKPLILHRLG